MITCQEKISFILIAFVITLTATNALGFDSFMNKLLAKKKCSFKFETDFPDKESVLLWNSDLLIEPENDAVVMSAGDEILISCPGSRNTIVETGASLNTAKCVSDQTLKIGTKTYLLSDLGCSTSVTGDYEVTTVECGNSQGVIKNIGHKVDNKFLTLMEVCYDDKNGDAIYTDHVIFGSAIAHAKSVSSRPGFKVGGTAPGVNANDAYKQASQKVTLTELLGSSELAEKYIHSSSYLARGHLAPDADQVFVTSSFSTYFYMNTVPQWQQANNGNWKSLEFSVRNVASALSQNFQVVTGGHEVLQLEDVNGNLVDIRLSGDKLAVPKYVWKVAYSLETQKGIAFVSVNNPFITEVTEDLYICTDICDELGWGTSGWTNPEKGLQYCCEIDDLRQAVPTIPEFEVSGIQEGPNALRFKSIE